MFGRFVRLKNCSNLLIYHTPWPNSRRSISWLTFGGLSGLEYVGGINFLEYVAAMLHSATAEVKNKRIEDNGLQCSRGFYATLRMWISYFVLGNFDYE